MDSGVSSSEPRYIYPSSVPIKPLNIIILRRSCLIQPLCAPLQQKRPVDASHASSPGQAVVTKLVTSAVSALDCIAPILGLNQQRRQDRWETRILSTRRTPEILHHEHSATSPLLYNLSTSPTSPRGVICSYDSQQDLVKLLEGLDQPRIVCPSLND
jgi:hypothetical protein